jgi:hypothetical protein
MPCVREHAFAGRFPITRPTRSYNSGTVRWYFNLLHSAKGTIVPVSDDANWVSPVYFGEDRKAGVKSATGKLSDYKRRMALAIRNIVMGANGVET